MIETTTITPNPRSLAARELWRYRDLLLIFALRDIKVRYAQTLLGPVWIILQPLALTAVFTTALKGFAGLSTDGLPAPLFYLTGLAVWFYFSQVALTTSQVFISNAYLFSKIYFPRLVLPLSTLASNVVGLAIQLGVVIAFVAGYSLSGDTSGITWRLALFPLVALQLAALSLAVGLPLAASAAKYRDMVHLAPFVIQVGMFATPIVYPFSDVPERFRWWLCVLNPLASIVEQTRWCFLGSSSISAEQVAASVLATSVLLILGILVFQASERRAMDTV